MSDDRDELARRCQQHMYDRDPAAQALGIAIVDGSAGFAKLTMKVRDDMLNAHAVCHGGFLFALADTAFAYACNSQNRATVAQGCAIDFLRPAGGGEKLTATARVRQHGRTAGVYDVSIENAAGDVVALFRGRSFSRDEPLLPE